MSLIRLCSVSFLISSLLITTLLSAIVATFLMDHYLSLNSQEHLHVLVSLWLGDLGGVLMFMASVSLFLDYYKKANRNEDLFINDRP